MDRRSLSVLESSSWDDGACPASEPATGIGGVLREPWFPSCFSGIERSLTWARVARKNIIHVQNDHCTTKLQR